MFRACAIKRAIVAGNMLCCCCCAAILGHCSVRDWTRICYVIGFENVWIHPSTRDSLRIYIFSTLGSGFKNVRIRCRIHRMRVDGSLFPRKKLWIQKCGSKNVRIRVEGASKSFVVPPGAIIGDGDRKSWDARGPIIWDNFSIFRTKCAILTSYIRAAPRTCRAFSRGCCHVA